MAANPGTAAFYGYTTTTVVTGASPGQVQRWRNHPQPSSLVSACLIFISGGMNLAMGLGWTKFWYNWDFLFSWFVAVAAGVIISSMLTTVLPKRIFMAISALLVIATGIIFIAAPYNFQAMLAARYINGFAIGFATVPYIVHASEISMECNRGFCLSLEQYSFAIGIAVQVIYDSQWSYDNTFSQHRLHGILSLVLGFFALATNFSIIESPIYYIRHCNDALALESLCRLRRPCVISNETKARLAELKAYVMENENLQFGGSFRKGLGPLLKMMLFRGVLAFTLALPLNYSLQVGTLISLGYYIGNWPPIVYGVLRLFGTIVSLYMLDLLGRKAFSLFSLLVMAGFSIGIGVIFSAVGNFSDSHQMSIVCVLLLIFQIFAGFYAPCTTIYLGEAFPLLVKPYFIALSVIMEQVVHIIVICTYNFEMFPFSPQSFDVYETYVFAICVGVITFALFLVFCVTMPETRRATLKQAQEQFQHMLNFKCF